MEFLRRDPSDPEWAGPSLTSAAVFSSTGPWSRKSYGWGYNHPTLHPLMFQPNPKSTLNVSNLSFHPTTHAVLASAIGRPIAELAQEWSSAAPLPPPRLAACREWSTWTSAALKGALVSFTLWWGRDFSHLHMSTAISPWIHQLPILGRFCFTELRVTTILRNPEIARILKLAPAQGWHAKSWSVPHFLPRTHPGFKLS